ncbi:MAG: hypothetical protein OXC80_05700 [Gammaproteobacteria bacterium]|nr:hypothetical protein [Gammaproteobacteria bacterium]
MPSTNWNPIEDLPHVERSVSVQLLEEQTQRWEKVCAGLGDRWVDKSYLDIWL